MIKNIVFDMGNVLFKYTPLKDIEISGITNDEDKKIIIEKYFNSEKEVEYECGRYTAEEFYDEIRKDIPKRLHKSLHWLIFHWADKLDIIDGMYELIKDLKNNGYKIYLLSNAELLQHNYFKNIPANTLFDGSVISCDVNCVKPLPDIYYSLYKKYSINPTESYFIDDFANKYIWCKINRDGWVCI